MTNLISTVDLVVISPMVALLLMSLIPVMMKVINGNKEPNPFVTVVYALLGVIIAIGITASLMGVKHRLVGFSAI